MRTTARKSRICRRDISLRSTFTIPTSTSRRFHYSNDNPDRRGVFDGFGHYEDELAKVNGKWLFTKRKIYNEGRDEWAYKGVKNPAW
jgi:hypothetical protein